MLVVLPRLTLVLTMASRLPNDANRPAVIAPVRAAVEEENLAGEHPASVPQCAHTE
jgi:hypothetical protein